MIVNINKSYPFREPRDRRESSVSRLDLRIKLLITGACFNFSKTYNRDLKTRDVTFA